jgi:hypothetical protein
MNKGNREKIGKFFIKTLDEIKKKQAESFMKLGGGAGIENFLDDDCISRMFEALKNNPPSLTNRLKVIFYQE